MSRVSARLAAVAMTAIASSAVNDCVRAGPLRTDPTVPPGTLTEVQVSAKLLDDARSSIRTRTGASTSRLTPRRSPRHRAGR